MFRRKQTIGPNWIKLSALLITVLVLWMTWHNAAKMFTSSDKSAALKVVETFYEKEQAGDYGSSWELFHSLMQQRFRKSDYIQMRAHVTMQDFGAKTFTFRLEEPKLLASWKISEDTPELLEVYKIIVIQKFHGSFGNFEVVQPCFVTKESGVWKVLWSYQNKVEEAVH